MPPITPPPVLIDLNGEWQTIPESKLQIRIIELKVGNGKRYFIEYRHKDWDMVSRIVKW